MSYREQPTGLPHAVLWRRGAQRGTSLILPDACLDVLWDGQRLFVAGPDRTARRHESSGGAGYVALRFAAGLGPALLGTPADELSDRTVGLAELLGAAPARELTEQVAADPEGALTAWLHRAAARADPDPLGPGLRHLAGNGPAVADLIDRTGLGPRQLHRRSLALFGYGPRHLIRVLRLERAVAGIRSGRALAAVAADSGYCDQAHLSREVHALTGTTPSRLAAELGPASTQASGANKSIGTPSGSWTTA